MAEIAGRNAQQDRGAEGISASWLALHALAEPEERRTFGEQTRGRNNLVGWNAGARLRDFRRRGLNIRFEPVKAEHVPVDKCFIDSAEASDDVQQAERQCGVCAWIELQVNIRLSCGLVRDRIDRDDRRIR